MRSKEEAHDYRYFPEPDLTPIIIQQEFIDETRANLPEMPAEKRQRFVRDYKIPQKDASIIIANKTLAHFYEDTVALGVDPKVVDNYILGDMLRLLNKKGLEPEDITMDPKNLAHLIQVIDEGKISKTAGKEVFAEMFDTNKSPDVIIEEKGLAQISSSDELEKLVDEVLKNNPQSIEDFKAGKKQAAGYLMGQVMKASKDQANPQIAKKMIDDKLAILV